MMRSQTRRRKPWQSFRRGVAAVEMAVSAVMLVIMLVGMTGTAQFIMLNQIVSNASRAAARHAVRLSTTSDTQVRGTVQDYMEGRLPSISDTVIGNALTVNVLDVDGAALTGTALGDFTSGDELAVEVQFSFDSVRWLPTYQAGKTITATTTMRRD